MNNNEKTASNECDRDEGVSSEIQRTAPNFFYIGTSKAGSTWIYNLLNHHPQVFIVAAKGLYFFDSHFDRGLEWYLRHFDAGEGHQVIGEISHSYLISRDASARIAEFSPRAKLMACLREPCDRAFSDYLDLVKNQKIDCSFEQAIEEHPSLIDRGRYATHLQPYLEQFGRDHLHIAVFDRLRGDPRGFAEELFRFLDISAIDLPPAMLKKMMPAGQPRSRRLAKWAKAASRATKQWGWRKLRGRVKTSRMVRNALYRQYEDADRPQMASATRESLKVVFRDEVKRTSALLDESLEKLWRY